MEGEVDDEDGTFTNISLADDSGKTDADCIAGCVAGSPSLKSDKPDTPAVYEHSAYVNKFQEAQSSGACVYGKIIL